MHTEEKQLDESLREFYQICERVRKMRFPDFCEGIPKADMTVLTNVNHCKNAGDDRIKVSDVVRTMKAPAPLISRSLKNLEDKGMIIREVDKKDRRNTLLTLTERGQEAIERSEARMLYFMQQVVSKVGMEEMAKFNAGMSRFIDAMEQEVKEINKETKDKGDKA